MKQLGFATGVGALLVATMFAASPALASPPVLRDTTIVVDGNLFFDNDGGNFNVASGGAACAGGTYTTTQLATVKFTNVTGVDPKINPQVYTLGNPRWNPQDGSPVLAGNGAQVRDANSLDPWFVNVPYLGAVPYTGGVDANDWTTGWTYYNTQGGLGRTDIDTTKTARVLTTNVNSDTTWHANTNIVLQGRIMVNPPHVLTIEPGTVVMATGVGSYLVIPRGSQIHAVGTRNAPIIFTSGRRWQEGKQAPGDWGGVVLHGRAWANCVGGCGLTNTGDCGSEGDQPGGVPYPFGGIEDTDNKGDIEYCRLEYSGFTVSLNNELNAWTQNGVGSGTIFQYNEACWCTDDGFEWFGGTVNEKYLVAAYNADDNFDWQMGYRGLVQFGVSVQASSALSPGLDKGIEADDNEFGFNCPLRSDPFFSNMTLVGAGPLAGGGPGINLRRGTAGKVINSVIMGFAGAGLSIQDTPTFDQCAGAPVPNQPPAVLGVGDSPAGERQLIVRAAPNPTAGAAHLSFSLGKGENVRVQVFSVTGRLVDTAYEGAMAAGDHTVTWTPKETAPGIYFYSVVTDSGAKAHGKLVVAR
jgi:hypothetical protein